MRADSDATNHTSCYLSGRRYGKRGMWGAAILHFRRAWLETRPTWPTGWL
ncbi:MAG: hypothetical protein L6R45_03900 [Anaerolineae bacterium]|nr:hypothetical protein [Anaerolineae bacterium]